MKPLIKTLMFVGTACASFTVGGLTFGAVVYTEADKQAIVSMLAYDTIDMLRNSVEQFYQVKVQETKVEKEIRKLYFVAIKDIDASVITIEMRLKKVDRFVYRWVEEQE